MSANAVCLGKSMNTPAPVAGFFWGAKTSIVFIYTCLWSNQAVYSQASQHILIPLVHISPLAEQKTPIRLRTDPYTRSAWPPGPIYHLLTTSPAWPGLNSPPKVPWWAELSISVPENGPFFKSEIEKNFRRFFFPKFFQRTNCFYGFKK